MPRERPQDPSLFCTSWRYKSSEFPFLCFENLPRPKNPAFCASWISIISNVQHLCASATSHFQHFFCCLEPQYCGCVKMGPFVLLAPFPLLRSHFWPIWGQSVVRPLVVLLVFLCFVVYGSCPNSPFVLSDRIMALSTHQKCYVLKGWYPILTRKIQKKTWEKMPKAQMVPFSRMYIPIYSYFPAFWHSGNPRKLKKPKFVMWIFGTQAAQQVVSDLQPANSPKHATHAGVQLMWESVLCNRN